MIERFDKKNRGFMGVAKPGLTSGAPDKINLWSFWFTWPSFIKYLFCFFVCSLIAYVLGWPRGVKFLFRIIVPVLCFCFRDTNKN
jgi:hypothetical protein